MSIIILTSSKKQKKTKAEQFDSTLKLFVTEISVSMFVFVLPHEFGCIRNSRKRDNNF